MLIQMISHLTFQSSWKNPSATKRMAKGLEVSSLTMFLFRTLHSLAKIFTQLLLAQSTMVTMKLLLRELRPAELD
jgi:hypothetical protein